MPLVRRFKPIKDEKLVDDGQFTNGFLGLSDSETWNGLRERFRTIILADAGAGKTHEMRSCARQLSSEGFYSFFIRIEDVHDSFELAFEVGSADDFRQWLEGQDDAWFFLDSIDEARLIDARFFEKAIRSFANRIHDAVHRARVFISSRPYAWRPQLDLALVNECLPHSEEAFRETAQSNGHKAAANGGVTNPRTHRLSVGAKKYLVYWLEPLNQDDIRKYADHRHAEKIDDLILALDKANLWPLAERPFDLDDLIKSWGAKRAFGTRLEVMQEGIERRLQEIDPDREDRQPLSLAKGREGAKLLAAAVTLTGEQGIKIPQGLHDSIGLNPALLMPSWQPAEVKALLARGIFNDAIYGAVRIRHREIRDLLTAQWLNGLLVGGGSRKKIESLFFAEQYGEIVVRPRFRSVLCWLILYDENIRDRALAISPEIAVEGGDVGGLPTLVRRTILLRVLDEIVTGRDEGTAQHFEAIVRIANHDLENDVRAQVQKHAKHSGAVFFLSRVILQAQMVQCLDSLYPIALDASLEIHARAVAIRSIAKLGDESQRRKIWQRLLDSGLHLEQKLLAELLDSCESPDQTSISLFLSSIAKLPDNVQQDVTGLTYSLRRFVDRFNLDASTADSLIPLLRLVQAFDQMLDEKPFIERGECRVSKKNIWLIEPALQAAERIVRAKSPLSFETRVISLLMKPPAAELYHGSVDGKHIERLTELIAQWPELSDELFWASVSAARVRVLEKRQERVTEVWQVGWHKHLWAMDVTAFPRLLSYMSSREMIDDRLVALSCAVQIYLKEGKPQSMLSRIRAAADEQEILKAAFDLALNPRITTDMEQHKQEELEWQIRIEHEKATEAANREEWLLALRSDPNRIRNPEGLKPGEFSNDQFCLLRHLEGASQSQDRDRGGDWRGLMPEFGEEVALAYRDAARMHWRASAPGLRSEGADGSQIPYSLLFGMAGLSIESQEVECFPRSLGASEFAKAVRYGFWELNGFPRWFEQLFKADPIQTLNAVWIELEWEISNTPAEDSLHYVLHDVVYYAAW